jgi:hypothetical protein
MLIFLGLEKVVDVNHLRSSMLIFLGVQTAVDVNHLLPSMLIFSLLVTGPHLLYLNVTLIIENNSSSPFDFGFYDITKTVGVRPLYSESS